MAATLLRSEPRAALLNETPPHSQTYAGYQLVAFAQSVSIGLSRIELTAPRGELEGLAHRLWPFGMRVRTPSRQ